MWRRWLKKIHPEGIPWPGTVLYNALTRSGVFQEHYQLLAEDIAAYCREGRVLDIGTGPGWLLIRLHEGCPGLALVGADISAGMVAKARENLNRAGLGAIVDVVEAGADRLPFAAESFDAVASTGSIHHWRDAGAGLREVYRVLRPGGWGLMYDLVADTPREVFQELVRKYGRGRTALCWLHSFEEPFYSVEDFAALAKGTPFQVMRVGFVGALCGLVLKKAGTARQAPGAAQE